MTLASGHRKVLGVFSAENLAKYWRYCRVYGVRNATRLAIRRLRTPMGNPQSVVTPLSLPVVMSSEDLASPIDKTVSVVVPTKNAASYIENLLEKLKSQKGIRSCEIILVDSGSTDGTVSRAEREGVSVVQITPQEFTHSFSRNAGAERARGDYLLFMVQDALPLTNLWLWEMARSLENNGLSAISCAEYPRSDSDLFYQFLIHNHNKSDTLNQDRILAWDESCSTYLGLRSNAQLSDVATLIRRDVFEKYHYQRNYAEDLDLGLRLIRDGHKLGFLRSTRVLHSHNRPPYYFLKRGYVDVRFLVEVFSSFLYPTVDDASRLYSDLVKTYGNLTHLGRILTDLAFPMKVDVLVEQVRSRLLRQDSDSVPADQASDPELHQFIRDLLTEDDISFFKSQARTNMILPHLLDYLERLAGWISGAYDMADVDLARDVVRAMHKAFALYGGTHLAYLYLTLAGRGNVEQTLARLDQTLLSGV